jgi:hypothetical protein
MMLLLEDFLGVRHVSWISHQLIDGCQRCFGCISQEEYSCSPRSYLEARKYLEISDLVM